MPPRTTILTLRMDERSQSLFEELRVRHYPAHLNQIGAHLTLFHTLPDAAWVREVIEGEAAGVSQFQLQVTGVRSLGRGVAYKLASEELSQLHQRLAAAFAAELSAQDRQRFSPHVVVQNKVAPEAAKALLAELDGSFVPFAVTAVGLDWWHYLGGPWELAERFGFAG